MHVIECKTVLHILIDRMQKFEHSYFSQPSTIPTMSGITELGLSAATTHPAASPINMKVNKYYGVSLLEMLVAALIGLVIMAGLFKVYLVLSRSYQLQQAWLQLRLKANAANHYLSYQSKN